MRTTLYFLRLFAPLVLVLPVYASAETSFAQAVGLFNVFVGLMLTTALVIYGTGFVVWFVRLGTWPTYRTEAIKIMEWSVVILFVLVVLLAIVQFFQYHPREARFVGSFILAVIIVWIIVVIAAKSGGGEKKESAEH
ncbi:hypothetical protein HY971_01450 [Candidatus Kaiserbacteria bacterium]|nr:hypothetical protein [Candidatus Kaiserbacteria bacterium]